MPSRLHSLGHSTGKFICGAPSQLILGTCCSANILVDLAIPHPKQSPAPKAKAAADEIDFDVICCANEAACEVVVAGTWSRRRRYAECEVISTFLPLLLHYCSCT
jgi:hypothetical protein